jgi:hypothetical protein
MTLMPTTTCETTSLSSPVYEKAQHIDHTTLLDVFRSRSPIRNSLLSWPTVHVVTWCRSTRHCCVHSCHSGVAGVERRRGASWRACAAPTVSAPCRFSCSAPTAESPSTRLLLGMCVTRATRRVDFFFFFFLHKAPRNVAQNRTSNQRFVDQSVILVRVVFDENRINVAS